MKNVNNKDNTNNTAQRRQRLMLYPIISRIRVISVLCLAIAGNVKRLWNELQTKAMEGCSADDDVHILRSQGYFVDAFRYLWVVPGDATDDAVDVQLIDNPEGTMQVVLVLSTSLDANGVALDLNQSAIDLFRVRDRDIGHVRLLACATGVDDA